MLYTNIENQNRRMRYKIFGLVSILVLAIVSVIVVVVSNGSMSTSSTNLLLKQSDNRENLKRQLFENWKALYNKNYLTGDEFDSRYQIWSKNYDWVEEYMRRPNLTFTVGMNEFADLTNEEYKTKLHIGACLLKNQSQKKNFAELNAQNLPSSIDWRKKGAVTPVKNQGQCGSCWAFSTTGSMEGLNFITNKKLVSLSEQQLVDCSESFGNQGCNGGLMDNAFQYTESKGLESESVYPYKAADGKCKYNSKNVIFKNKGFKDVPEDDNNALAAAVANQPVSIGIEADSMAFQMYTGGIFNDDSCGTNIDHGVLLVGYGAEDDEEFWIVKNSWGDQWGENGFIRMAKQSGSGAGMCGIASSASYPTYKSENFASNETMEMENKFSKSVSIKDEEEDESDNMNYRESTMNAKKSSTNPLKIDILGQSYSLKQEDIDDISNILTNAITNIQNSDFNISIKNQLEEVLNELNNQTSPFFISSSINYRQGDDK